MAIFSIEGEEKTKKTSFLLSMPLPQVGFAFDPGIERAIAGWRPLTEDASVKVVEYGLDLKTKDEFQNLVEEQGESGITILMLPTQIQMDSGKVQGVLEMWQFFQACIAFCMTHPLFGPGKGSTWIDTMTLCRRTANDAYLQQVQKQDHSRIQLIEIEYGKPNGWIRDIYNNYGALRRNLGVSHHLTDERRDVVDDRGRNQSVKTGRQILEGLNGTYRFVDVALRFVKPERKPANAEWQVEAEWKVCGYNLSNEGQKLYDPTWDMATSILEAQLAGAITFPKRAVVNAVK